AGGEGGVGWGGVRRGWGRGLGGRAAVQADVAAIRSGALGRGGGVGAAPRTAGVADGLVVIDGAPRARRRVDAGAVIAHDHVLAGLVLVAAIDTDLAVA